MAGVGMEQMSLIDEFKQDLRVVGLSWSAIDQYPRIIRLLYEFTGGDLLGVTEDILVRYLGHLRTKNLSHATIKHYFATFGVFYDFLVMKKYIAVNPVTSAFRKHYLNRSLKKHDASQRRQCITVEQAKMLVESILDVKELALVVLGLKTGLRRTEISTLCVEDVDMKNMVIHVQPTRKRSNEIIYFDRETQVVLGQWLALREKRNKNHISALFLERFGNRLSSKAVNEIVVKHATVVGLHDPKSKRLDRQLTAYSLRHFFSTRIREAGMPREFVMELRGDSSANAFDIYYHIDRKRLQQSYLNTIPQFGLI